MTNDHHTTPEQIHLPTGTTEDVANVARLVLKLDDAGRLRVVLLVSTEDNGDYALTLGDQARDALLGGAHWLHTRTDDELRVAAQRLANVEDRP